MGQLWLHFWSRLFIKKMIPPTLSRFTTLGAFPLFYFPFPKHKILRKLKEVTVPDKTISEYLTIFNGIFFFFFLAAQ